MKTNTFLEKSIYGAFKQIQCDKQDFIKETGYLRTISIQNKEGFSGVFNNAKEGGSVETQVILSPMYDNDGGLSVDENYFLEEKSDLSGRIQKKVKLSTDILKFLTEYFELKVNFIIADSGLLLCDNNVINEGDIDDKVNKSISIFQKQIANIYQSDDFTVSKMSDTNLNIERVRDMNFIPTVEDCEKLIIEKSIAPNSLLPGLNAIIKMYGITAAYYEVEAYFKESEFIGDNYKNNIIVNIEGSSLGNQKLVKGKNNLTIPRENGNGGNLLVGAVINPYL